jgi:outer membrane biosynthesis protein TonB
MRLNFEFFKQFLEEIMCCKNFWKRIIPFAIAFIIGFGIVNIPQKLNNTDEAQNNVEPTNEIVYQSEVSRLNNRTGSSSHHLSNRKSYFFSDNFPRESSSKNTADFSKSNSRNVQITSKPGATYTDLAEQNNVQGIVTLRVTFLANGKIGVILPVTNLPDGLTEQAIEVAKQIKFEPAMRNGQPVSVTKQIQYGFTIY